MEFNAGSLRIHLIPPTDDVVLTPIVALKFLASEVRQNHLFSYASYDLNSVGEP